MRLPIVPKEEVAVSETKIGFCLAVVAGTPEAALAVQCRAVSDRFFPASCLRCHLLSRFLIRCSVVQSHHLLLLRHFATCRVGCAPYTAPIAVYVAQRHQMAAAVHGRNRAQMRPSGEIARMAHPTQPMATDRVRGRSRTRISPHPSYSGYIGGSTEFHGLQEAKIGHFGGFRRSGNRFEMR